MKLYDYITLIMCGVWILATLTIGRPILNGQEQAAWVQAVGSILAILAAVGIAWWQVLQARRDRSLSDLMRRRNLEKAAVDTAQFVADHIYPPALFLRDERSRAIMRKDGLPSIAFRIADEAITAFPFYELGDPLALNVLNSMRGSLGSVQRIGERILSLEEGDSELDRQLRALWHVTDQTTEDLLRLGEAYDLPVRAGDIDMDDFRSQVQREAEEKGWPRV